MTDAADSVDVDFDTTLLDTEQSKRTFPPSFSLSPEQQQAITLITDWLFSPTPTKLEYKLGGYAGTGKTTVIKYLIDELDKKQHWSELVAFTGKAVNVLQKKGLRSARTIHSLIYETDVKPDGTVEFHLRTKLDSRPKVIICDEASMVSTELYTDLKSFGIKLLFIGDPGQLEPVGENPNLMRQPDFTLQTIHRQAAQSPIITFAHNIRNGGKPTPKIDTGLLIRSKAGIRIPDLVEASQVICAKNKTRTEVNRKFRVHLNKPINEVQEGDKLIILRNNRDFLVFNGMIVFVTKVHNDFGDYWKIDVEDEVGKEYTKLPLWKEPFITELQKDFIIPRLPFRDGKKGAMYVYADFGYCITCHKSQGSEWDHVVVWDEWMPPQVWDMKRWRYTAITRAAKQLTYCI